MALKPVRRSFASVLRFFLVLNRTVFLFNRICQFSMALSASGALGIRGRVAAISNFVFKIRSNLLPLFFAVCPPRRAPCGAYGGHAQNHDGQAGNLVLRQRAALHVAYVLPCSCHRRGFDGLRLPGAWLLHDHHGLHGLRRAPRLMSTCRSACVCDGCTSRP